MGFTGLHIVAKTASSLDSLAAIHTLGEFEYARAGTTGWQLARINRRDADGDVTMGALIDEVGGPVLCADIRHSDTAIIRLTAPGWKTARFVLNERAAADFRIRVDPAAQAAAPAMVLAWAGGGDLARVEAAIRWEAPFVEDRVMALTVAFGALSVGEFPFAIFNATL